MLLLLVACLGPVPDDSGFSTDFTMVSDTEETGTTPDSTTTDEEEPVDDDQDGWTPDDGDCDDEDDDVHPGAEDDECDGIDNNCDGEVDEQFDGDRSGGTDFGVLDEEDQASEDGYLFPEGDEDAFTFYLEDGTWSWFSITVEASDVPEGLDIQLALELIEDVDGDDQGRVAYADEGAAGDDESLYYGGVSGFDDSGTYAVVVSADGADCEVGYSVTVITGK